MNLLLLSFNYILYVSRFLILLFVFANCTEDRESKINQIDVVASPVLSNDYIPLKMSYFLILGQKNPKIGTIIFDTDNVTLRYFDGEKWDFISNLKGDSSLKKNIIDINSTVPDSLNQIGWYNDSWYIVKSLTISPFWVKVNFEYDILPELTLGDKLEKQRIIISKSSSEQFAHDSKILVNNGTGFIAYYSNDNSKYEGKKNQVIRLAVFKLNNPRDIEFFDVFAPNSKYDNIKTDYLSTYTPVIFLTKENKIRVLGRLYVNYVERYYFRDFDPITKLFSQPNLCKVKIKDGSIVDFNTKNIEKHIDLMFGSDVVISKNKNFMFLVSESVEKDSFIYLGLTLGEFTGKNIKILVRL